MGMSMHFQFINCFVCRSSNSRHRSATLKAECVAVNFSGGSGIIPSSCEMQSMGQWQPFTVNRFTPQPLWDTKSASEPTSMGWIQQKGVTCLYSSISCRGNMMTFWTGHSQAKLFFLSSIRMNAVTWGSMCLRPLLQNQTWLHFKSLQLQETIKVLAIWSFFPWVLWKVPHSYEMTRLLSRPKYFPTAEYA